MKRFYSLLLIFGTVAMAHAQTPEPVPTPAKPDPYILIPEPRSMRSAISGSFGESRLTIFTPARDPKGDGNLQPYTTEEFKKLGISFESFLDRARQSADRRLATLKPDLIKDNAGRVRYAVYRGPEAIYASLILAPSLGKIFEKIFGTDVWLAAPDRNALYVFPANAPVVDDFAADLEERFHSNPYSASEEVFSLNAKGELKAMGQFTEK